MGWGSALAAGLLLLACQCEAFAPANMPARILLTGVSAVQMKGVPPRPLNPSAPKGSAAARLRLLLDKPGILTMPCCFDALSARLIERAGFEISFMSGSPRRLPS